ncbi:glycosyltransferase family 4 protein [Micromonospora sp. WMMA1363]|uniref:glycosyltransferase family 4 protein n=1 Tax=Micromonospora sp. WMMA1363 TaxID=3053985 RepID=UPI00259D07FA|nr:glycosyltransferase family 4 protein [Micromonospora sp. WMMA1363]MDM4718293.1 glycosyltransferase family 4 protein [Micromonospora sp. WMMA1363]
MLVDNAVKGDSRVQKAAWSAAEAGWDVILLGRGRAGQPESWELGQAEVRLVPMVAPMAKRRRELRRVWQRGLLAYPPNGVASYRQQQMKAWRADLRVRADQLRLAAAAGGNDQRLRLQQRMLRAERAAARITQKWVSFRFWQLTQGQNARRNSMGPLSRVSTWFWEAVKGDGAWRRLEPGLWDYELAYGPVIDELRPDLIHANDYKMLGVGARATIRARAAGRDVNLVWDAHEFLPGLNPALAKGSWLRAQCAHEREYAPFADAVVTVSEALAELLRQQHSLSERPAVVMNAPSVSGADDADSREFLDLRTRCGIGADTPLLAYSGGIAPVRGVDVMVDGLPQLPGVHIALVSLPPGRPSTPFIDKLLARAAELGVAGRVHVLPYVAHNQVARFLSAADAAVSPLHHLPNHEIALSNKFFEYSHARLPIVVSDVKTMAEMVRTTGQGEVFRAKDVDDYVRAVRAVLADPARYRAAYDRPSLLEEWTWETQAKVLDEVYRRLAPEKAPTVARENESLMLEVGA